MKKEIIFQLLITFCFLFLSTTKAYSQSTIEENFNLNLNQIGYDVFNKTSLENNDKFEKNHKLNIGDKVKIYFWGDSIDMLSLTGNSTMQPVEQSQVDTNGNLFVPGIGMIPAQDKTIEDVEKRVKSLTSSKYSNAKVQISLDDSAEFFVYVYGFVKQPGKVGVNNNCSIIEVLSAAGGIDKNGSLRSVIYQSGKTLQDIDLYETILKGNSPDLKIKSGDKFFVNSIGNVVAIKNGVTIPGIYESKFNESIETLVSYAGGFVPSINKENFLVERYDLILKQRAAKQLSFDKLNNLSIVNGDILTFNTLYNNAENYVKITGNIKHPGVFEYKDNLKLSDILKSEDELLEKTYSAQAVINRVSGPNKEIETIPVSLTNFFNGVVDPELKPQDLIKIYQSTQMATIEVSGYVKNPGLIPYKAGMTLNDLLKSVIIGSNSNNIESVNKNLDIDKSNIVAEITTPEKEIKTIYLYDLMTKNNANANVTLTSADKILFRPVTEKEVLRTVKVYGYVNNPGIFKVAQGKRLSDALKEAGNISEDGFLKGIIFIRPAVADAQIKASQKYKNTVMLDTAAEVLNFKDTSSENKKNQIGISEFKAIQNEELAASFENIEVGRINLKIKTNDINKLSDEENILIREGDEIYIPQKSNHVLVAGEVYNQAGFAYMENMKVKDYIKKAGGFTKLAEKGDVYVISANGFSSQIKNFRQEIEPGDTIIVPKKVNKPINWVEVLKSIAQIGFNSLNTVFILTKI